MPSAITSFIQRRLSRVTSSGQFIPEIDGLRFLAISTVVALHLSTHVSRSVAVNWRVPPSQDPLGWLAEHGAKGVCVFFAISGFILALPFALHHRREARKPRLKSYFLRRITRLEPPYVVTMLGFFAIWALLITIGKPPPNAPGTVGEMVPHLFASLGYVHNMVYGRGSTINGVAWTLEIEVQFYILAPLLACVFMIRPKWPRRAAIVGLLLALLVPSMIYKPEMDRCWMGYSFLSLGHWFIVGFLLVEVFIEDWNLKPTSGSLAWDLVGIAGILGTFLVADAALAPTAVGRVLWECVPVACLFLTMVAAFKGRLLRAFFVYPWITVIGGMCYTIYLLHYAFIAFAVGATKRVHLGDQYWVNYLLQGALVIPALLVVSAIFFALVERPCMRRDWPQRLWAFLRRRPYTPAPSAH